MKITNGMSRAVNAEAWAIGFVDRANKGFHVRRVYWHRLIARKAKTKGEQIRRAYLIVADKASR